MILPRAAAPSIDQRNESEVSTSEKGIFEKIIPFITLKEITPVASLKSDSPSIIRFSLFGIGNLLKIAATAAASVAASNEPKRDLLLLTLMPRTRTTSFVLTCSARVSGYSHALHAYSRRTRDIVRDT
jgi:hypothetical protein